MENEPHNLTMGTLIRWRMGKEVAIQQVTAYYMPL